MGYWLLILVLATIGAAGTMGHYRRLIWPETVSRSSAGQRPTAGRSGPRVAPAGARRRVQDRERRSNAPMPRSPQQNAENASVQRSNVQGERSAQPALTAADGQLIITAKELTQLAAALTAVAGGASKQAALETAWECSKGAGQQWKRASQLYDLATAGPSTAQDQRPGKTLATG